MAICLIGTKPGEVKAFRRDYENDEWKNLAEDQRNSQVQVLNDNSLLFFRVIPDDKSKVGSRVCFKSPTRLILLRTGAQNPSS